VDRTYVHGGRVDDIVASRVSGVWYNHHYDAQGNCIIQSGDNGRIQVQYDYDAFGFPYVYTASGSKGNAQTRFLFTGREWISDLRLYDYRARMYQPELGRFLQPDPVEFAASDYNLYRYCHNDPVNKSDPTGLREELAGEIMRDRMWDFACLGDSGNSFQGSLGDFNNRLYNHDGGGGGGGGGDGPGGGSGGGRGSTPIPRRITNDRLKLGGNATDPQGSPSHYTDEKITANGEPAAGRTIPGLIANSDGTVSATADLQVRRRDAMKHPELLPLEWQHVDAWRIWVGRMNSNFGPGFARYSHDQNGANAMKDFLQPYWTAERARQHNDYHQGHDGKPALHHWPYPLED
jgi:RHS repeat-associated protein